jgi:hypothetical protein
VYIIFITRFFLSDYEGVELAYLRGPPGPVEEIYPCYVERSRLREAKLSSL